MKYLLDTDTCIYILREQPPGVLARFKRLRTDAIGISAVVMAELAFGAAKSASPRNHERLATFLSMLTIVPFDAEAAAAYGGLRAELERRGRPIGPMDLLISAQALALDLVLVTNNEREFKRVPGLRLENWTHG
jgi:tRNA(fMet)-specific endonuclease VapC